MGKVERIITYLAVGIAGIMIGDCIGQKAYNRIPMQSIVQSGYAVPSKLEITVADLDHNGIKETILKYDNKTYLLLYDGNMPKIVPYEVKPAEIVPKE